MYAKKNGLWIPEFLAICPMPDLSPPCSDPSRSKASCSLLLSKARILLKADASPCGPHRGAPEKRSSHLEGRGGLGAL